MRTAIEEVAGLLFNGRPIRYAVLRAETLVEVEHDLLTVARMEAGESSVEARLIGGVHRMEHAPKLVIECVSEVLGAPQQVVGLLRLLVQEDRIELRHGSREFHDLPLAQCDRIWR